MSQEAQLLQIIVDKILKRLRTKVILLGAQGSQQSVYKTGKI